MSAACDEPECSPRGDRGMNVLPASQFLQDRLNERRARQLRPKRVRHTDFGVQPTRGRDDDIFFAEAEESRNTRLYDSSPLVAGSSRGSDAGTSHSERRRRTLGVRDMDDQLDRLQKQNFALKLELDHRRELTQKLQQQMQSMQDQVQRALVMEDEHKELLRINIQLVQELEKRDKAVEEAMDIICDLEEQVSELQEHGSATRPSTAHADSGYAGTEMQDQDLHSSPPRAIVVPNMPVVNVQPPSDHASAASQKLQGVLNTQTPAKPKRQPSVLSSRKPSTHALRSVYMENSNSLRPVQSFQSLLEKPETWAGEESDDLPSSPRLSALSESSFPSIYSPTKDVSPEQFVWETADGPEGLAASLGSRAHMRNDSIKRVSQWMSARDAVEATPSKSKRTSSPLQDESDRNSTSSAQGPYQSLDNALAADVEPAALEPAPELKQFQHHLRRQKPGMSDPRPISYAGPAFGDHNMPPTPESVSTRMLRESRSSIIKDRSPLDAVPASVTGYNWPEPGLRTAPRQMRSSVELRTAYNSNLQFRSTALDGHHNDDSSDEEYVRRVPRGDPTNAAKDFRVDYDGYPDGKSIKEGTPSRFQSHSRPPPDVMFNHNDLSPTLKPRVPRRRRSSEQTVGEPTKPRLECMEISSSMLGTTGQMMDGVSKLSVESAVSPHSARSYHSTSSGNRTITGEEHSSRPLSPSTTPANPVTSPRSRTSPSPLRKKMPSFIRRFSNTTVNEKSPLPTLTSTPSSAYVSSGPPRPQTSHADRNPKSTGGTTLPRRPSNRETRAHPLARARTEMHTARPASAAGTEKERRSLFRRSNSVKKTEAQDDVTRDGPDRSSFPKRRGSIRDAVASRRPWR